MRPQPISALLAASLVALAVALPVKADSRDRELCVGFGVGTPEQAAAVGALADGVIVGAAIVRCVETHASSPHFVSEVGDFIAALKAPLRN